MEQIDFEKMDLAEMFMYLDSSDPEIRKEGRKLVCQNIAHLYCENQRLKEKVEKIKEILK